MTGQGLGLLKANGFRPVGPWVVDVGRWSEVTYLFRFDSLAERERLIARFSGHRGREDLRRQVGELTEEVTTRLLVPAPFSAPRAAQPATAKPRTRRPLRPAASGSDRSRRPRGRLFRPLRFRQLRLGRAGRGDAADRPASRHPRVRITWRWSAATTGKPARTLVLDTRPRGRRSHLQGVARTRDHARRRLARDAVVAAGETRCAGSGIFEALLPGKPRSAMSRRRRRVPAARRVAGTGGAAVYLPGRCGPLRGADWSSTVRAPAGRQRHGAVGRDVAAARSPGGEARRPRVRLVGRARPGRSPAPVPDRASPAGRLPHRPGPAARRPARSGPPPPPIPRLDALRQPDRRGHRPRLPRADRAARPIPRPADAFGVGSSGRTPWS